MSSGHHRIARGSANVTELSPCIACPVRETSVCGAVGREELHRLAAIRSPVVVDEGATIFLEGDPSQFLFNVTRGVVKVYKLLRDGRRLITGFFYPGDFLGLALQDCYAYTSEAVTEAGLCRFERGKLERLCDEIPGFERRILRNATNELAAAQDQMLLLGRKDAVERVATFLLMCLDRAHARGDDGGVLRLRMTRGDTADYLGLSLETTSRTFSGLVRSGVVSLPESNEVVIRDRAVLVEIAGLDDDEPLAARAASF